MNGIRGVRGRRAVGVEVLDEGHHYVVKDEANGEGRGLRYFERSDGESPKAYTAFATFRDLGSTRTLREVATVLYGEGYRSSTRRVPGRIKNWSARYAWRERARAYDDHIEMIRRTAVEEYERGCATDRAAREAAHRERIFLSEERAAVIESELLDRFERMLDALPPVEREEVHSADGTPIKVVFKPFTPDIVLSIVRLHAIASRAVPLRRGSGQEERRVVGQAERERLEELAGDPKIGDLFMRLFPQNPPQNGDSVSGGYG